MRGESGEDDENCECERKREEGGKNVSLQKIAIFFRFIGVEREDCVFFPICGPFSRLTKTSQHPVESTITKQRDGVGG